MTQYLPIGYTIKDHDHSCEYTIKSVLGRGASTIAYLADYSDGSSYTSERILKEYYPISLDISRDVSGELVHAGNTTEKFSEGLARYKNGGALQNDLRRRACLKNETPPLQRMFNSNNTCYLDVVPFEGRTFDKFDTFTFHERLKICLAVAKLINQYHKEGYLYLDLKPENIFVLTNSAGEVVTDMVVLIDFDSVIKRDQVVFGKSLSFTKSWAAPEQINPHGFRKISEATDIYAIGELVFWSVFNRHSTEEEHRGFSAYPFGDAIRPAIQQKLAILFRHTLRSSSRNRFQKIQDAIEIISQICEELSKKTYVIAREVRPNDFFIGRECEHNTLTSMLKDNRLVFLCGIGGIGKSEIAKQYASQKKHQYENILFWSFSKDWEHTICQDDQVMISSIARIDEETDHSYCWRKLRAIKSCLQGNNLIIIDNLNSRIEDTESQEVWEYLQTLPCDFIVSSRAEQLDHVLHVRELSDTNDLRAIFSRYCPFSTEQEENVNDIIDHLNRHTLLIELIAKQAHASMRTPQETLMLLEAHGVYATGAETVGLLKDGQRVRATASQHIANVFSMVDMTQEQKLLLAKMAFMPPAGISANDFSSYFSLENKESINRLVENGWINREDNLGTTLSIHPIIAEVIIATMKSEIALQKIFFDDVAKALSWKSKVIPQLTHERLCNSIAQNTISSDFASRPAAIYLIRHSNHPSVRSNAIKNAEQYKRAISYLEQNATGKQYCAILEYAYLCYLGCVPSSLAIDDSIQSCRTHLARARKAKDWYLAARFCHLLYELITQKHSTRDGSLKKLLGAIGYYFVGFYFWLKLDSRMKKKNRLATEEYFRDLDYDYLINTMSRYDAIFHMELASFLEGDSSTLFCSKPMYSDVQNLRRAITQRRCIRQDNVLRPTRNSIEIVVDEARILYLNGNYKEALSKLDTIVEMFNDKGLLPTPSLYRVHQFLGNISATIGDYDTAVTELKLCLEIGEELQTRDNFLAQNQLGRFLNEVARIEESAELNAEVLSILEQMDIDSRKSHLGDALYNQATLQLLQGNPNGAIKTYGKAISEYRQCNAQMEFIYIGYARCYRKLFEIYKKYGKQELAEQRYEQARDWYLSCLGENHPEVQDFLRQAPKN